MAKETEFKRKLFNKGSRRIDYAREVGGLKVTLQLPPQKSAAFNDEEANKLLRLFKSELIDMDNVTVESLTSVGAGAEVERQANNDESEIARRLEDARILRKQKAFDAAVAEGFSPKEAREIAGLPSLDDGEDAEKKAEAPAKAPEKGKAKE